MSLLLPGFSNFSQLLKYRVICEQVNVIHDSIYPAPLFTVHFPFFQEAQYTEVLLYQMLPVASSWHAVATVYLLNFSNYMSWLSKGCGLHVQLTIIMIVAYSKFSNTRTGAKNFTWLA
jgi:hypothetical protein